MRLKLPVIVLGLVAFVISPLAARQSPQGQAQVPVPEGYPASGQPPIVKLVSAGAQPRMALRYKIPNNLKTSFDMAMSISMNMEMGGMAMPAMAMPGMKMTGDITVTSVTPEGDTTYDLSSIDMGFDNSSTVDPNIMATMQGMLAGMKDLHATFVVTNRGVTKSTNMDMSKIDPGLQQTLGPMSTSFEQMSLPFPEEAVGVGAKWEVRQSMNSGGIQMFQKVSMEVTALDNQSVTLSTKTEQTAPQQAVTNPAMPPGTDVTLQSMTGAGTATSKVRFDHPVPTSEGSVQTTMVMDVGMGGSTQRMTIKNDTKVTMAPKAIRK